MFKLTLRELFLIVTLSAVVFAWWLDHRRVEAALVKAETESQATLAKIEAEKDS